MGNRLNKFLLLMWKNWTLLKRNLSITACEIICPVLICLLLVFVRSQIQIKTKGPYFFETFDIAESFYIYRDRYLCAPPIVGYSPTSPFLERAVSTSMQTICNTTYPIPVQGFANAKELDLAVEGSSNFTAALQFNDNAAGAVSRDDLPKNLDFIIRLRSSNDVGKKYVWLTDHLYDLYPTYQKPGPRAGDDGRLGAEPDYVIRGFLFLQQVITFAIINNGNTTLPEPAIKMTRFPYPEYLEDYFTSNIVEFVITLAIMFAFMNNYINTIKAITTEKEHQLKESMKIMGLPGWLHWLAWFLRTFVIQLIAVILIVIILTVNVSRAPVFPHSDASVLFILFILFICAIITFSFLVSVFFTKANIATNVGNLIYILTYLLYTLKAQPNSTITAGSALGSSLLCNVALAYGISVILKFEAVEEGIQWNNMWKTTSPDHHVTLGPIFLILLLDIFLYLGLALYVEAIFPGEFGVPQPWYFPFTRAYWCGERVNMVNEQRIQSKGEYFEDFTENLPIGIQLQNLSKTFGSNKAVKKLNLDMYQGHITVLLGHNGAGKTTTMSMITGMFPPTSGTAIVEGYDVRTNIGHVRDSMGLCLQHNVLFNDLTVYEHLYFVGKLKGLKGNEINREIDYYLKRLELEDKRNAASKTLSGGMKRKLSVGMALCGHSQVVMLDEPTAGMDPSARRAIWNLLQKEKEGRTILLTTHFMDEADLLGDRIAILTGGELQCCGSSYFLKKKYGAGYYLIIDVAPHCDPSRITKLLQDYLQHVEIFSHVGSELTYQLSEHDSKIFEDMLYSIEVNSARLGVRSYGMSLTTLEEVFIKVGADHDNKTSKNYIANNNNKKNKKNGNPSEIGIETANIIQMPYLDGLPLVKNQFIAMSLKKVISAWRSWFLYILQIGLPVLLLIVLSTILNGGNDVPLSEFPSLKITLDSYSEPMTVYEPNENEYSTIYKDILKEHDLVKMKNISDEIFQLTLESPANVKMHYLVGATFNPNGIIAWFNGNPYHTPPLTLALVLNIFYKKELGSDHSINFYNHPLPLNMDNQLADLAYNLRGIQIARILGFGMAFVASLYIIFYIRERVSKAKHLQFVSGVNVFIFWGTSFLCDLITYLIIVCAIIITVAALQEDGFKTADELGRITLVLVYFGFFVLPFIYLTSFLFNIPSTGYTVIMVIGTMSALIGIIVIQILEIENLHLMYVAKPLNWVLLFLPFYSVAKGAYDLTSITSMREVCTKQVPLETACLANKMCCGIDNYYAMTTPGIGRNILVSFLMSFFLFAVLITNEFGFFSFLASKIVNYNKPPVKTVDLEPDVQEENNKIKNTSETVLTRDYLLVLRDVTKYYKKLLAVNGICLGVKRYECFGLLGVNGAGKTSTFKMMTGDEQISYGQAWLNGLNIKTEQKKVQKLIGYCPQFDALLDDLTARETLKIFALIRGVPWEKCRLLGEHLAHQFDFFKHLDKKVNELSGGTKRKLSTALALIGDPPVIYLDEPSTGMDPATKRFLWTALAKLRDSGKCIILTSHSMEECEALCTRIAIMVNGTFQCLGSTQRLKNKFAQGYTLTIKMKKIDNINLEKEISSINNFVEKNFPGAQLKEKYQDQLSYQLIDTSIPWSKMFGILERGKKKLSIEDYALGQCSLEQVIRENKVPDVINAHLTLNQVYFVIIYLNKTNNV